MHRGRRGGARGGGRWNRRGDEENASGRGSGRWGGGDAQSDACDSSSFSPSTGRGRGDRRAQHRGRGSSSGIIKRGHNQREYATRVNKVARLSTPSTESAWRFMYAVTRPDSRGLDKRAIDRFLQVCTMLAFLHCSANQSRHA